MRDRVYGGRLLAIVLLVAFALNYVWEMAQMPAYTDGLGRPFRGGLLAVASHCLLATIGDTVIIGLNFVAVGAIRSRPDWIRRLGWREVILVSLPLVLLAIGVEWINGHLLRQWRYSTLMPVLPVVGIGLLPTVQLPLLTLLTFRIAGRIGRGRPHCG